MNYSLDAEQSVSLLVYIHPVLVDVCSALGQCSTTKQKSCDDLLVFRWHSKYMIGSSLYFHVTLEADVVDMVGSGVCAR